jgi:hypothetical protein
LILPCKINFSIFRSSSFKVGRTGLLDVGGDAGFNAIFEFAILSYFVGFLFTGINIPPLALFCCFWLLLDACFFFSDTGGETAPPFLLSGDLPLEGGEAKKPDKNPPALALDGLSLRLVLVGAAVTKGVPE